MDFGTQYFSTQNRRLAFALATAGCQLAPKPTQNLYTVDFLRSRGIGVGLTPEEAAKVAMAKKIPGIVTYFFVRSDLLMEAIKAWDDMAKAAKEAKEKGEEDIAPKVATVQVMEVLYVFSRNSKALSELAWLSPPLVSSVAVAKTGTPENYTMTGKGKVWTVGASQQIREHLKL